MKVDPRLYDISPFWAKILEKSKSATALKKVYETPNLARQTMRLDKFHCCVVGESYGFSSDYQSAPSMAYCNTCNHFALNFIVFKSETSEEVIPRMESLITEFCDHVDKEHRSP